MKYFICHYYKYIILWSPKTGFTTMCSLLSQLYDISEEQLAKRAHTNSITKEQYEKYKDYKIIILFRNPYDRLVSSFRHYIKILGFNITFNEFINNFHRYNRDHHVYGQCTDGGYKFYKLMCEDNRAFDYILDTSKNMEQLCSILSKITGKQLVYKIENVSNNTIKTDIFTDKNNVYVGDIKLNNIAKIHDYNNFYNNESRELVKKILKEDVEFYDRHVK